MPDPASPVSMELPEEIEMAIEALEIASHVLGGNFVSMLDADEADRGACQAREVLIAAILSRLREAEAGREEAVRERDDARCVGEANARAADANLAAVEACEAARDAALARVERLEKALKPFAKMAEPVLTEKPSWATPEAYAFRLHPGAVAVTFGDFFRAHDALSEAPPQGEQ